MLDLNLIKTKPEYVKAALKKKGWDVDFTSTIEKMDKRLELIQKVEVVKAEINKLSASVPVVKKNGGDYHLYSAENAIDGILLEGNEERIRVFLKKWIKAIVG